MATLALPHFAAEKTCFLRMAANGRFTVNPTGGFFTETVKFLLKEGGWNHPGWRGGMVQREERRATG